MLRNVRGVREAKHMIWVLLGTAPSMVAAIVLDFLFVIRPAWENLTPGLFLLLFPLLIGLAVPIGLVVFVILAIVLLILVGPGPPDEQSNYHWGS